MVSLGGTLLLGSVANGVVGIEASSAGLESSAGVERSLLGVDYGGVSAFADIELSDRALLDVSAAVPGQIFLQGRDISILDSSAVLAETIPADLAPLSRPEVSGKGPGLIRLESTETVTVSGFTQSPSLPFNPPFNSYLSVDVAPGATSAGGSVDVRARNVVVRDGGQIGANTFGEGSAGLLNVAARETVALKGGSFLGPSGLFAATGTAGQGRSGDINIEAEHLLMTEGAQVLTSSFNRGSAGSVTVDANKVSLLGVSAPLDVFASDGDLPVAAGELAEIVSPTLLQLTMGELSSGRGGDLSITTERLLVADGAEITTGTKGAGAAGNIEITATEVEVSGAAETEGPSTILTTVGIGATGAGGALTIDTERLSVLGGAQISSGTGGAGTAGDLTINSRESVLVAGQTPQGRSGLLANAIRGSGEGGNLVVNTDLLQVTDGGTLSVSNFASSASSPIPPGQGAAGDLRVSAGEIELSGQSLLSADTAAGDRGNIAIETALLVLRDSSRITTNATGEATGGNIDIDAPQGFVLAVPTENSDITANAVFGDGGRVAVEAQQVLGLRTRPTLTALSDITASSEFGVAGEILLETPDTVVRNQAAALPAATGEPTLAQGCEAGRDRSGRFVQSGRGGISANPYGILNGRDSLADVSLPSGLAGELSGENQTSAPPLSSQSAQIVEAQGWAMNEAGETVLLAAQPMNESERCLGWRL